MLLVPKKNMTKASCLHENIQRVGWTISYKGLPWESIGQDLPSNAGNEGSIPGQRTKTPYAMEQLSPFTTTSEPRCPWSPHHNWREDPVCHY